MPSDLAVLSKLLLTDIFGDRTQKRVMTLMLENLSARGPSAVLHAAVTIQPILQELRDRGQADLATFTSNWAEVIKEEDGHSTVTGEVLLLYRKVCLVQTWEAWAVQAKDGDTSSSLSTFLDEQGYPSFHGVTIASRIAKFLCKKTRKSSTSRCDRCIRHANLHRLRSLRS